MYGKVRKETEENTNFVPFLFQGQYLDTETELVYNYKRYYSQETGAYISQDPIGLAGGNPTLYGYVKDPNSWIDVFGLACSSTQMSNNRKNGKKAENFIHDRLLNNPDVEIIGRNVTVFFDKADGGGVRYIDILARNKKTGKIINVEVKSGKAKRSEKQINKDTLINQGKGIFGENGFINKNDPLIGQKTNNTTTSVTQVELWKL
ncbi:RHS repeat-associated core domain-containing protein [Treponema pedis]|uniref:RHS repeat-associated core domain-containing protein n=1 Tax=Treponema pedis TaxID=409322 RepID=UPI0021F2DCB5|nr:RHS repeat-associated core domain-containing protein [Treponema pedis]